MLAKSGWDNFCYIELIRLFLLTNSLPIFNITSPGWQHERVATEVTEEQSDQN